MRTRAWLLVLAAAVVLVLGCLSPGSDPGGDGDAQPDPSRQTTEGTTFEGDIELALSTVEEYWRARFEATGERFTPVKEVIPYTRDGEVSCGGEPLPRNNAVYCSAGDLIAYDVNFAKTANDRVGDAFVYYLLGHEYAHAVQVRLGIEYSYTIQQELQADCMAGAYLGDTIQANRLALEEGDIEEFQRGLLAVGDDPSVPWFTPGAHGTAEQRTAAFFNGYQNSLNACGIE